MLVSALSSRAAAAPWPRAEDACGGGVGHWIIRKGSELGAARGGGGHHRQLRAGGVGAVSPQSLTARARAADRVVAAMLFAPTGVAAC